MDLKKFSARATLIVIAVALSACTTKGVVNGTVDTAAFATKTVVNGAIGAGRIVARGVGAGDGE